jgi:HSP20 family protein
MRWQPLREMVTYNQMMDHLFDEFLGRRPANYGIVGIPEVDMYQTDDDVVVKATLPGVKAEDINISVTGDGLTIRGEIKEEKVTDKANYHLHERRSGTFARSITLPTSVVSDKAQAVFEDGVLNLTLPKAEEVKPKSITIKAK